MKLQHIKIFFIWLVLVNLPPLLCSTGSDFLHLVFFLPYLFWINIPGLWLGLAIVVGQPHYDIQEFGALPQTPLAWILIALFWILIAIALTALTARVLKLVCYKRKKKHSTNSAQTQNKA